MLILPFSNSAYLLSVTTATDTAMLRVVMSAVEGISDFFLRCSPLNSYFFRASLCFTPFCFTSSHMSRSQHDSSKSTCNCRITLRIYLHVMICHHVSLPCQSCQSFPFPLCYFQHSP